MLLAQAADGLGSNSTLLGALLSGALIGAAYSAYKFIVNFRTTERGLARQRILQANKGERSAQYEASLWQARCGDLEYRLKQNGIPVPAYASELIPFVTPEKAAAVSVEDPTADQTGGRPA